MDLKGFDLLKFISIIQRNTRRYFDLMLEGDGIGSGQQFFLLWIYENSGITMHELSRSGSFDKATATKAVQKLAEEGYVTVTVDQADKRVRHLAVTEKARALVQKIYRLRSRWCQRILDGLDEKQQQRLGSALQRMADASSAGREWFCQHGKEEQYV